MNLLRAYKAMDFRYSKNAKNDLIAWKKSGRVSILAKIKAIEVEISKHPTATTGKYNPEALKHELSGWFSREITRKDRFIYRPDPTNENVIEVIQCKGHYRDT